MAEYTYKNEGDRFVLYENDKPLTNPDGVVIVTSNEELAEDLVAELKEGKDYTSPSSLLAFHYTYCNLEQRDREELLKQFAQVTDYERLIWDEYLMLHQSSPVKQAIASYMEAELPECLREYNLYQLTAIYLACTVYESIMLPYYIIADICTPLVDEEDADYESLKASFLEDLKEYECEVFEANPKEKSYKRHIQEIDGMIDAFVYYFNL